MTRLLAPLLLALFVLGAGCTSPKTPAHVVALVDLSGSLPAETLEKYRTDISSQIWLRLAASDALTLLPIDGAAETRSEVLFFEDLASRSFSQPGDGFAKKAEKERARLQEHLKGRDGELRDAISSAATARRAFRGGTDILGAIKAAANRMPKNGTANRVLVIFSDMIQESEELDVRGLRGTGEPRVEAMIESLAQKGLIASMPGVRVVVAGGSGAAGDTDKAFYRALRSFWVEYFRRAGASLEEGHYGYGAADVVPGLLHPPKKE